MTKKARFRYLVKKQELDEHPFAYEADQVGHEHLGETGVPLDVCRR